MSFIEQILAAANTDADDEPGKFFYRYREVIYSAGCDEWGDPLPGRGRMSIELDKIPVIKRTPCGAWIGWSEGEKKFVNLNWNKRFALPTLEEARASFLARKKREASIMRARMRTAEEAIEMARAMWAGK